MNRFDLQLREQVRVKEEFGFSPDVEEINPRTMDDMFVVENGNNAPGVPIGPLIPNETPRIAELLAGASQIIPEDMKDIKIYQEEIRTVGKKI